MSIEAREKAATDRTEKLAGWHSVCGIANCTVCFLLAQLRDANEKIEALKEAGVTDYSKPPWGFNNRVDCNFCPSSWRADRPPEHKANCPLDRILKGGE